MAIEDLIRSAEAYEKERLDVSVSSASSKSPDQVAKVYNLSKEKGLPFDYVERNYESASAVDTSTLTPSVAKLLRDRRKAQLSHDDIDNLSWWEIAAQESGNIGRLVPSALKSISSAGYATLGGTFNALSELSLAPIRALNLSTEEDIQKGDWLGDIGKSMMEIAASEKADAEYYMPKKTLMNQAVVGGLRSAIINAPALVAGVVSRNPNVALGAMGGITYGDSYLTGKQSGLDELSSVSYAANQAIAEIATERLPAIKLLKDIGADAGMLKTIATQMAIEIPSEQLATVWQDAIDWAVLNPEKTLKEFMQERPDAAVNTLISTVVASGLQTSAIVGIDRLTREKEKEQIDQLTAKANESKLRGRSPEVFADYVDDLIEDYGSADAVYLDAKEARPLFQRMEKDDVYDLIASQIDEAEAIGGDIVIPMRDFVTSVAGSKNLASIKDYLRLSPESPTASQIDGQPQRVIDLIKDANKNIETKNRADEIYKEVTKQLINTGRMNADTAKTSASIIPAYVTSKSIRSGLSVDEIYGMMGITIQGSQTGKPEALSEDVLRQSGLSITEDNKELKISSENGYLKGKINGDTFKVSSVKINESKRNTGEATKLYKNLVDHVHARGLTFVSDNLVEGQVAKIYEKLSAEGYEVTTNKTLRKLAPDDKSPLGTFTTDDDGPVFEVKSKAKSTLGQSAGGVVGGRQTAVFFQDHTKVDDQLRVVDVFGNGSKIQYFDDRKNIGYEKQTYKSGAEKWRVLEVIDGIDYWMSDKEFDSMEDAKKAVKSLKAVNTRKKNQQEKYGNIPDLWKGEEGKIAKSIIDAGYSVDRFSGSSQSKSKYIYLDNGLKVRISDHDLPLSYDRPDVDYRYGGDINGLIEKIASKSKLLEQSTGETRGSFDPSTGIIKLTEASDLSTFLHESGHLFLEMEGRLFNHPNATEQMKADGGVILDWLGLDSFDQLKDYEANDVSREAHEKFARGFEKYLGEGKAPSVELKAVFRRFAAWMRQVYRDLTKLNVELTDDVRAVMDRMLASDDQINRLRNGFDPLFKDAKDAGMTEAEFKAYSAESTLDNGKEKLLSKMMKQLERHYTKWWKDESVVVASKVRAEVEKLPLYSALSSMRTGGTTKEGKALALEVDRLEESLRKITRGNLTVKQAIARAGGINRKDAIDNGVDPEYVKARFTSQGKPLFPATGGLSFDGIAELLNQEGYNLDANGALDLVNSVLASDQFVNMDIEAQASNLRDEIDQKSASLAGFGANRLNYDEVHSHFFGDIPGRFIGLTSKNGSSADDLAAIHGLASGAELIDLINTEPTLGAKVKQLTEQEMIRRHGDILNDGTIKEEAEQAIRNPEQAKRLIAELSALSRKTGENAVDRETIKAYAKETIGKMAVSKIRPAQYRQAEIRAARDAASAKTKGDFKAAQKAKTQEIINFYLAREATAAKQKAEKIRASQKAIQTRKYSASNIDMDHVNEAKVLLRAYDFRKTSEKDVAIARANINQVRLWIESQQKDPNSVATFVQAEVLGRLIPYSDMTLEDLQGLDDVVNSILHSGRVMAEENKEEYRANINIGKESIISNRIETYETEADSGIPWVKAKSIFNEATASLRKFESLARQADGMNEQGWVWKNTVKPLLDAANEKLRRQRKAHDDLREIFKGFNGAFSHMKDIRTFTTDAGQKIRLSYGARISIALNLGNDGNVEALKTANKLPLTDSDINKIVGTLSDADFDLVQSIWDYVDTYWPEIANLEIKRSGVAPQKVSARPFVTPSGKEMRGGYYPLAGDSAADGKQLDQDIDTMASAMMNGGASSKSTKHGSTIERVGFGGKKIDFSINVLFNHIDGIIHDVTHWKAVKDVDRVLKNEKINSELSSSLGLAGVKAMKQRLKEIAAGPQRLDGLGWINRVLRHARLASTYSALGYSVRTALMNTMGLTTAIAEMNPKVVAAGAVEYYSNLSKMNKFILDKSEYMRDRGLVLNRDIAYIRSNLRGDNAFTKFKDGAFWMMTQTDKAITRPIWLAAYRQGEMMFDSEQQAIDHADRMVARTQGSGMDLDLANVETKNELMKTMTVMYTAFSAIYNITAEQIKRYKSGKISGTNLALRMAWLTVVPGILTSLLTGSDDDEPEDVVWEIAGQGIGMIPIARDAFSYARYGSSFPTPMVRLATAPIKFVDQVSQGEVDKGLIGAGSELASWLHIPGGAQLTRTYGYLSDMQDGEIEEFSPVDLLITGKE